MPLTSVNPSNLKIIETHKEHSDQEIQGILNKCDKAQKHWSSTKLKFRLEIIKVVGFVLKDNKNDYASMIVKEMGKPFSQAKSEIEKCIWLCEYYYSEALGILKDKIIINDKKKSFISYQPIGIVLGIMPWNFPFWQVFRFVIPTLIVGNGVILKHASNVQGCAKEIESCLLEAGFPDYIFKNISITSENVVKVIKNPLISAITLTGSTPAGRSVAKTAGKLLKKTVLELGGNDPYIVLADADIDNAIKSCIDGRILNTGQSCISAKRIIVVRKIHKHFVKKLVDELSVKIMGDPMDDVDIGPMVSIGSREEVHEQVISTIKSGGRLVMGGEIPSFQGAYYPITIIDEVKPGMTAFDDEIFGPVFSVIIANDEEHAVNLANDTSFGLGAAIFTKDIFKGETIAKTKLNAGLCYVNDFVKSDPRLPFGGVKDSGYGRELSSYGMLEFTNIKTVSINKI